MITIERLNWLLENAASSEVREMAEAMFSMRRQIAEIIDGKENAIAAAVEAEREAWKDCESYINAQCHRWACAPWSNEYKEARKLQETILARQNP